MNSPGRRRALLTAWLLCIVGLGFYVQQTLRINTDLRSFMPAPQTPEQKFLLEEIGAGPGARLLMLALSGAPPERLATLSQAFAQSLRSDSHFRRVLNGAIDLSSLDTTLLTYRYLLSPTLDTINFDSAYLREQLEQRIADLGSPAATLLKPWLSRDPTLESLKVTESWQPPREPEQLFDVWFSQDHQQALLLVETDAPGFDPQEQNEAIEALKSNFHKLSSSTSEQMEISGPGAFAVLIHATTSQQASWIGLFDSVGFFLLLLLAYRRLSMVLLGSLPLLGAGLLGMAALGMVFGGAHGITLAFGFTLIGVAQDYPIHLFSHLHAGLSPQASARALWPALSTGVISTCIAYLAFLASGVTGLMQLAVFTIVGLLTAALSTRYLLPRLLPTITRDAADSAWLQRLWNRLATLPRSRWLLRLSVIAAIAFIVLLPGRFWENNLAALTPVPQPLLAREESLRTELGAPDIRYLLVVQGNDTENVLQASELLDSNLQQWVQMHFIDGYDSPSRYLPSAAKQRQRQARLPDPEALEHALKTAQQDLPFKTDLFMPFRDEVKQARNLEPLTVDQVTTTSLGLKLQSMILQHDGHWLALISLIGVHDPKALQQVVDESGQATLLDLKHASESLVTLYRQRILISLALAAGLLIVVVAYALRSWSRVSRVLTPMLLSSLFILALLRIGGVSLTLFHLIALILAAGLGLDYALFFEHVANDRREQLRTLHAVLVCSVSTFFVFALLAASSLPVLRAIGVTVGIGIFCNFILAILIARPQEK